MLTGHVDVFHILGHWIVKSSFLNVKNYGEFENNMYF